MASGIVIDKYYVRDDKNGNHRIRLVSNKKKPHIISDSVYQKFLSKYIYGVNQKKSNDFPNHPIVYDKKMIYLNKKIQKLGDSK